jgi:guanylate kinase
MEVQKLEGYFFEVGIHNNNLYGTSINSVKDVSSSGLHCVLDVRGDAIRELQKKTMFPIAIYIKPKVNNRTRAPLIDDQVAWLQEMNKRLTRENCIKIIEQAERTEAEFADCFTAAVSGDSMADIYKGVLDVIELHGKSRCWLPSGETL